jgi:hypothetical protein
MPVGQLSIRADHDSRPLVVLDCFGDDFPLYKGRQRGTHHVLGAAVDRQRRLEHFVLKRAVIGLWSTLPKSRWRVGTSRRCPGESGWLLLSDPSQTLAARLCQEH